MPGSLIHAFVRLFAQFGAPEYHIVLGEADPTFVASNEWRSHGDGPLPTLQSFEYWRQQVLRR